MKRDIIVAIVALALVFSPVVPCLAAQSRIINVTAVIPTVNTGMNVSIYKIIAADCTGTIDTSWTPNQTAINFGTLWFDSQNNIFRTGTNLTNGFYYAVDIGVVDNTGTVWTITHTRTSLAQGGNDLNSNVNVVFKKAVFVDATHTNETELAKVSYQNSNSIAYTKTALAGGWLRIYYGVATGNLPGNTGGPGGVQCVPDATGVVPIGLNKPAGTYAGSVTLTLTP